MVEIVLNTTDFGPSQTITGSVLSPPDGTPMELQFRGLEIIGGLLEDLGSNPGILARTYFDQRLQLSPDDAADFSIRLPPVNYPAPQRSPHSDAAQSFEIAYHLRLLSSSSQEELFVLPVPLHPRLQTRLPGSSSSSSSPASLPIVRQAQDDRGKECLVTKVTLSQPDYLPGEQIVAGVCIETPRGSRVPKRAQYQLQQRVECRMPGNPWSRTLELSAWRPLTLTSLGVGLAASAQQQKQQQQQQQQEDSSGLADPLDNNKQATANIHQSVAPSASYLAGHFLKFSLELVISVTLVNSLTRASSHTVHTTTPLQQQPCREADKETGTARFSLGAFQNKNKPHGDVNVNVNVNGDGDGGDGGVSSTSTLKQPAARGLLTLEEAQDEDDMLPQLLLLSTCGGFVTPPNEPFLGDLASAVNMAAERVLNDKEWDRPQTVYLAALPGQQQQQQSVAEFAEENVDVQDAISQLAPAAISPPASRPASSSSSGTHRFQDFLGGLEFFDASDKLGPELTGMLSADPAQLTFGVTLAGQMVATTAADGDLQLRKSMSMPNGEGAQIVGDTVTITSTGQPAAAATAAATQMYSPGATTQSGARSVHEMPARPRALVRKHWTIKGTHISARSVITAVTQSSKLSRIPTTANPIARGGMLKSIGQRFSQWFN